MTEQEKMLAGKIYDPSDETLLAIRTKAHKLCQTYNQTADTEEKAREQMLRDLIPDCAKGVYLQGPIYFDYGEFTTIGENTFDIPHIDLMSELGGYRANSLVNETAGIYRRETA